MNGVYFPAFNYLVTAAIITRVSEVVKISGRLGAFIAALPKVTILVLIWMYMENQPHARITIHVWYALWYVIPTLPMFLVFPSLYARMEFWPALLLCCLLTAVFYVFLFLFLSFSAFNSFRQSLINHSNEELLV